MYVLDFAGGGAVHLVGKQNMLYIHVGLSRAACIPLSYAKFCNGHNSKIYSRNQLKLSA